MLAFVAIALAGGGAFYIGWRLFSGEVQASAAKRLEQQRKRSSSALLRMSRPLFNMLVMPYSQKMKLENWRKKNRRYIISAGLDAELDVDELLAFKIFLGFIAPLSIYAYFLANGAAMAIWLLLAMMAAGYFYPSIWVMSTRKNRHIEIQLQLPFVIDLLTLSTEAGLDFIGALQKVVEKTRMGPLVGEVERTLQEIQLGTTRSDSLRNMAWRIDLSVINSLVAVLVTADQMGSSIGAVLRVQSDLIRNKRFTEAEKKGAAASQKLLFPLIFFIMPAVFIMIFGPMILGFLGAK